MGSGSASAIYNFIQLKQGSDIYSICEAFNGNNDMFNVKR